MSNNIPATTPTIFNFDNSQIRTVTVDGEPWFVAADVAATLGYTNTSKAINDHCKGVTKRYIPTRPLWSHRKGWILSGGSSFRTCRAGCSNMPRFTGYCPQKIRIQ